MLETTKKSLLIEQLNNLIIFSTNKKDRNKLNYLVEHNL